MSKPVSAKQLAANRRNAQKSTGPRTRAGRAVSRMNALKHGLLSKQVLVHGITLQESESEYRTLHRSFRDDLKPEGPVEEMLVEQIVTAHWRLRRALAAEAGEIALNMDRECRGRKRQRVLHQSFEWTLGDDVSAAMQENSHGNILLGLWLEKVRDSVTAEGALDEAAVKEFAARFHGKPNRLVRELEDLLRSQQHDTAPVDEAQREKHKAAALGFLNLRIAHCRHRWERCIEQEDVAERAHRAADSLPSVEVLDKIHRYETKLDRQMYRAMAQLERLQRMRRGETVPAPLAVEISTRI